MNKSELVEKITISSELTKADANKFIESFVDVVTQALKEGDQISLPKLGTFCTGNRAARAGRNPQTGAPIEIKASRVAKFKAGKSLKEALQER